MTSTAIKAIVGPLKLVLVFAAFAAAYKPSVKWGPCNATYPSNLDCGTIEVPMNHAKPDGPKVPLALARLKANQTCGTRRGLFLENGGPGAPNIQNLVSAAKSIAQGQSNGPANDAVRLVYDQIAVDMRGTGLSVPLKCDPDLWNVLSYDPITDKATYTDTASRAKAFGQSCINMTGPLINYLGTDQAVQDFEAVREALEYDKFNYLGFSYGTKIGYDYAQKYPHKVGRMVLDGIVNFDYSIEDKWAASAFGFERTLDDFFSWCNTTTECALHGQDQPRIWDTVMDWTARGELLNATCATQSCSNNKSAVTESELVYTVENNLHDGTMLGDKFSWQNVSIGLNFTYVEKSDARIVSAPATETSSSQDWPNYSEITLQCADRPVRKLSAADFRNANTLLGALAPHTRGFGIQARVNVICNEWPVPARNPPKIDLDQMRKLPPVMLVNAFYDPATPSPLGLGIRPQMPTAFSVYRNGGGHTSYKHQGATALAEAAFLINGTIPTDGTVYKT